MFARLRNQTILWKIMVMFGYGIVTFLGIYYTGAIFLDNIVFFRVFELLWFVHILIISHQIQRSQSEMFMIATVGLLPGIIHNVYSAFVF